jgi:hypothetical protein
MILISTLCGCAEMQETRIKDSWQAMSLAVQECNAKKERGEIKTFHERAVCINTAALATRGSIASELGQTDFLMRENAYRLQLGDERDRGLSQAQAETKWATFWATLVADAQQRQAADENARRQLAASIIASGALTPRPPVQTAVPTQTVPAPNRSINCTSLGAGNAVYTNCY